LNPSALLRTGSAQRLVLNRLRIFGEPSAGTIETVATPWHDSEDAGETLAKQSTVKLFGSKSRFRAVSARSPSAHCICHSLESQRC